MLSPSSEGPSSGVQQTEGQTEEPMKVFYGSDLHGALSLSHLPLATINGHHGSSESSNEGRMTVTVIDNNGQVVPAPTEEVMRIHGAHICFRVAARLFIGGALAAKDKQQMKTLGITHIVNMVGQNLYNLEWMGGTETSYFPNDFKYLCLSTADVDYEDLSVHFKKTSAFIEEGVQQGGVLVHCFMGISRSTTVLAAYLMDHENHSAKQAVSQIQKVRTIAQPNPGFMRQLEQYQCLLEQQTTAAGAQKSVGVGIHLARKNTGEVYVKDVKVGGAAAAAGVQPDRKEIRKTLIRGTLICRWKGTTVLTIQNLRSIIHHVNGQPIKGMDTRKVRDQILGEAGSTIVLKLQAPGSQQIDSCTLVRTAGPDEKGLDGVDRVSGRTSLVEFEEDKVNEVVPAEDNVVPAEDNVVPAEDKVLLVEDKVNDVKANCFGVFFRGKRPAIPAVSV